MGSRDRPRNEARGEDGERREGKGDERWQGGAQGAIHEGSIVPARARVNSGLAGAGRTDTMRRCAPSDRAARCFRPDEEIAMTAYKARLRRKKAKLKQNKIKDKVRAQKKAAKRR